MGEGCKEPGNLHFSPEDTWVKIRVPASRRPLMKLILSFPLDGFGPYYKPGTPIHPSP